MLHKDENCTHILHKIQKIREMKHEGRSSSYYKKRDKSVGRSLQRVHRTKNQSRNELLHIRGKNSVKKREEIRRDPFEDGPDGTAENVPTGHICTGSTERDEKG